MPLRAKPRAKPRHVRAFAPRLRPVGPCAAARGEGFFASDRARAARHRKEIAVGTNQFAARAVVLVLVLVGGGAALACNQERRQECDRFLAAMKPLEEGTPTPEAVDRVRQDVEGLNLQDQPLHIYATNYTQTLTVLASTMRLNADPAAAPDGTIDVIRTRLKAARTDREDVARYCAE
jgi:hypothetical protein